MTLPPDLSDMVKAIRASMPSTQLEILGLTLKLSGELPQERFADFLGILQSIADEIAKLEKFCAALVSSNPDAMATLAKMQQEFTLLTASSTQPN